MIRFLLRGFHTALGIYPYIRKGIFHNTWEFSLLVPQLSRPLTSAILHFMELMAYRAKPKNWHYPQVVGPQKMYHLGPRPQVVRSTKEDVPPGAAAPTGTLNRGRCTSGGRRPKWWIWNPGHPKSPQDAPGRPNLVPKTAQEPPKTLPEPPKSCPKRTQEAANGRLRAK